jgi:hypothetical protein
MTDARASRGFRFPAEVILWVVRWYLQFPLSYREFERMLADRGLAVDHTTMCRWSSASRRSSRSAGAGTCGRAAGRAWHVDETYLGVGVASGATCTGRSTAPAGRSASCSAPNRRFLAGRRAGPRETGTRLPPCPRALSTERRGIENVGFSEEKGRDRCRRGEPQGSDRHTHGCAGAARVIPEPPVAISQSCAGMAPTGVAWGGRRDSTPVPLGARAAVRPGRLPLARERRPRTASSGTRVLRRESRGAGGGRPGGL